MKRWLRGWLGAIAIAGAGTPACDDASDRIASTPSESEGGEPASSDGGTGAGSTGDLGGAAALGEGGAATAGRDAGGAGAGGEGPLVLEGPPRIVDVQPPVDDDDPSVDPTTSIVLTFSETLDASTITADTVRLLREGTPVEGDVSVDGRVVTFTPTRRLWLSAPHSIQVSTDVTDSTGDALESEFLGLFWTSDGQWLQPLPVLSDGRLFNHLSEKASMGIDAHGNVLVVWSELKDVVAQRFIVMARWYRQATGWEPALELSRQHEIFDDPAYTNTRASVAVSPAGDAVAVWTGDQISYHPTGTYKTVQASRYHAGQWSRVTVSALESELEPTMEEPPNVLLRDSTAVLSWRWGQTPAPDTRTHQLFATSWHLDEPGPRAPTLLEPRAAQATVTEVASSMNAAGNAMLIGYSSLAGEANLDCFTFDAGSDVFETRDIGTSQLTPPSGQKALALDAEGNGMLLWTRFVGEDVGVWTSRYANPDGFSAPEPLQLGQARLQGRHSLISTGFAFFATWLHEETPYVAYYRPDGLLIGPVKLDAEGAHYEQYPPIVTSDMRSNAMVVWTRQSGSSAEIYASRFLGWDGAWSGPTVVLEQAHYDANLVAAASAENGITAILSQSSTPDDPVKQPRLHLFQ